VKKRQWLSGIAISLCVTGISYGQSYKSPGAGLSPSSYPAPSVPLYQNNPYPQTVAGGSYPYLAQNAAPAPAVPHEHIHVPQANYTTPGGINQPVQPAGTSPLPPVYNPPAGNAAQAPIYQPAQSDSASPPPQPQSVGDPYMAGSSCSSCQATTGPMGQVWSGYANSNCSQGTDYGQTNMMQSGSTSPWIFGANGLVFKRPDHDFVRLSINDANTGASVLSTLDARMRTSGGFEVFGGRYFGCGKYAVIGSYWGIFPEDQTRIIYDPELDTTFGNSIRSSLPFTVRLPSGLATTEHGVEMPGGAPVAGPDGGRTIYAWYNNAYAHRLTRSQDFNNVEVNFLSFALGGAARNGIAGYGTCGGQAGGWANGRIGRGGLGQSGFGLGGCSSCGSRDCGGCGMSNASCTTGACAPITGAQCSNLRFAMLGGLRWFRFGDNMNYATSDDATFDANDVYYRNNVRNDLIGFQLGGRATYCTGRRVNLYTGTKFGVFGNRVNYDTYIGNTTTAAIVSSYDSYDNQAFDIRSAVTGLSLLGEMELGTGVRLSRGWTANCGYRVIGVSGVATTASQIPQDFSLLNDVRRIRHDDSLILHGISFGGMYNW